MFTFNQNYNAYIEVLPFDKMLRDSRMRNQVFFESLGLIKGLNLQIKYNTSEQWASYGVRKPRRLRDLRLSLSYASCTVRRYDPSR